MSMPHVGIWVLVHISAHAMQGGWALLVLVLMQALAPMVAMRVQSPLVRRQAISTRPQRRKIALVTVRLRHKQVASSPDIHSLEAFLVTLRVRRDTHSRLHRVRTAARPHRHVQIMEMRAHPLRANLPDAHIRLQLVLMVARLLRNLLVNSQATTIHRQLARTEALQPVKQHAS